jgi:hypothetical protein
VELLNQYEQTGALPRDSLERYTALAKDMIAAYTTDDLEALQRLKDYYQPERPPNPDQFRAGVRELLGRPADVEDESHNLALADAQLLVARLQGFESWPDLVKHTEG